MKNTMVITLDESDIKQAISNYVKDRLGVDVENEEITINHSRLNGRPCYIAKVNYGSKEVK